MRAAVCSKYTRRSSLGWQMKSALGAMDRSSEARSLPEPARTTPGGLQRRLPREATGCCACPSGPWRWRSGCESAGRCPGASSGNHKARGPISGSPPLATIRVNAMPTKRGASRSLNSSGENTHPLPLRQILAKTLSPRGCTASLHHKQLIKRPVFFNRTSWLWLIRDGGNHEDL